MSDQGRDTRSGGASWTRGALLLDGATYQGNAKSYRHCANARILDVFLGGAENISEVQGLVVGGALAPIPPPPGSVHALYFYFGLPEGPSAGSKYRTTTVLKE